MSPEQKPLLLPRVVREGGLEEVTPEWGFAEIPDRVEEEEQGVALLRLSHPATSIPYKLIIINPNFYQSRASVRSDRIYILKSLVEKAELDSVCIGG